jgi:hypothetical protein
MAYDLYGNWTEDEDQYADFGMPGSTVNQPQPSGTTDGGYNAYDQNGGSAGVDLGDITISDSDAAQRQAQVDSYFSQLQDRAGELGNVSTEGYYDDLMRHAFYDQNDAGGAFSSLMSQLDQRSAYDGTSVGDRDGGGSTALSGTYSGSGSGTGTSGSGSGTGGTNDALSQFMSYLTSRQTTADGYQSQLRDMLLNQLGIASQPVSASDPGIKQILDAQALTAQRSAERQQSMLAARNSADYLGDSGAQDTGMLGIEQDRGEAVMRGQADVLYQELNNRRTQLTQLLQLAVSSGDAQAAQAIQAQLAGITLQLQNQQYYSGLGERRYEFDNDLGYRLLMAEMLGNQNALSFL